MYVPKVHVKLSPAVDTVDGMQSETSGCRVLALPFTEVPEIHAMHNGFDAHPY